MDKEEAAPTAARISLDRIYGSMPWLRAVEKKHYRARVFKSGNSLAVRLPAGTALAAGMDMDLTIEDGKYLSMEPIDSPKKKFNISKVAGSARELIPIKDEDRVFEERSLYGHHTDGSDGREPE